jgi:hypothetical protein
MTIDSTVKRIGPPAAIEMLAGGGLAALIVFSVGVFLLVIPILGWVVGPALMVTAGLIAIAHLAEVFWSKAEYAGACPYCGAPANAPGPESVGECHACNHRFIQRNGELQKIEQ